MNIVILSYLTLSTGLLYHGPKRHGGDRPEEGEAIHRSRSKVMTAAEAVARFVRPGSTLGMGGQNVGRCPMALTHEIIRQRIGDLTVVGCNLSIAMDQLVGAGLVRRTVCGSGNLERFGTTLCWRRAVEEGAVEVVDYSHLAMVTRFLAGEMGVPFMPTRSLLGSDLLRPPAAPGPAPGPPPPDRPVGADALGNAIIEGFATHEPEMARASRHVVVSCEELVSTDEIRAHPEATTLPFLYVDAVVVQPFGAYPTSTYRFYDYDAVHVAEYQAAARAGPDAVQAYLEAYVWGCPSFDAYLQRAAGRERLEALRRTMRELV